MRRKAQISGFSEMPWALLLLVILVVFAIYMSYDASAQATEALTPISWEEQWIANNLAQHPLGGQTLLEALRDPANDEAVDETLHRALNSTVLSKQRYIAAYAVRDGERVACKYRRADGANVLPCAQTGTVAGGDITGRYAQLISAHHARPAALEEQLRSWDGSVGAVHGPKGVLVAVVGAQ